MDKVVQLERLDWKCDVAHFICHLFLFHIAALSWSPCVLFQTSPLVYHWRDFEGAGFDGGRREGRGGGVGVRRVQQSKSLTLNTALQ